MGTGSTSGLSSMTSSEEEEIFTIQTRTDVITPTTTGLPQATTVGIVARRNWFMMRG